MERRSKRAVGVPVLLVFLTLIPIVMGLVRFVQVPTHSLPDESLYFYETPWALAFHGLCGALFGLLGPLQFWTAFRRRFGWLHKLSGRIFVVSGVVLSLSGLRMVAAFMGNDINLTDASRVLFSIALLIGMWLAISSIRNGDLPRHRAWVIRSYAIGMGTAPIAFVLFPVFLITGVPPTGLAVDLIFVGTWITSIAAAEIVIRFVIPTRQSQRLTSQHWKGDPA
ncbi:DUF2306 domain-containing protein [Flavimaricola marinus]|uniref:DUF2306 domain-containing protein n=1 Tax=Flavimaricola marinus TaxID=1819565 RepID=A0A238LGG8_9RHOB|nr:DUF2306 domain-containing protein [Flavimaricola marinus]SMY08514.1 hypothetical protein LOM8899_02667 [Flavimaricola marinus]